MHIGMMMFEVTRRCNAKCRHCLRGAAQNVNISDDVIEAALKGVTSIDSISFTGGEPSLAVSRINKILQVVKNNKIEVGNFYLVTNGKKASLPLVHSMINWHNYCYENEYSSFCISKDKFHKEEISCFKDAEKMYGALSFYNKDERNRLDLSLINEGFAMENEIGEREIIVNFSKVEKGEAIEEVYISALGEILPCCDLSYQRQKEEALGNILKDKISDIFYS
jgi:hypothetical protein